MRYGWLSVAIMMVMFVDGAREAVAQTLKLPGGTVVGEVLSSTPARIQASEQHKPVKVAGGVMAANLVESPQPICSPEHKGDKVSGTVVLDAIIGVDGRVANLNVISGPEALRGCVLDAVSGWTYKPYLVDGVAVEVETTITLKLDSGGL
jgi:outer membrane biosynthesis protein TonB